MQENVNTTWYYTTQTWPMLGAEQRNSERVRIRKTLLVNMRILHGIFEDEAAAYATLLQFSEFYKAAGGCVPV